MTIPYTYTLTFLPTKQIYYGVSYREKCHPEELMKSYFSSSRVVWDLIEEFGADSFQPKVRKRFTSKKAARDWEQRFLRRVSAATNPRFLNQSNNMKGILREPGAYTWIYNSKTKERKLWKKTNPVPQGFLTGQRGPDQKQKNTKIITNILTGKEKRVRIDDVTPKGFILKRLRGTTTGTMWICNRVTGETRLISNVAPVPAGWDRGNLYINNKDKIKVYKEDPYQCISIHPDDYEEYAIQGWKKGNPKSGRCPIFKMSEDRSIQEQKTILASEYPLYEQAGWFKGKPIQYRIHFIDDETITAPYQWFEKYLGIKKTMILYAAARETCYSRKYRFTKVEVITDT